MGYLANGVCYKTDLIAAQFMCSNWHGTELTASSKSIHYCYKAEIVGIGKAALTMVLRDVTSTNTFTDTYQTPWVTLLPCDYVDPSVSFKASQEDYQAVTVIFSAVLVALCVAWGFRQIIRIFSTHPEA